MAILVAAISGWCGCWIGLLSTLHPDATNTKIDDVLGVWPLHWGLWSLGGNSRKEIFGLEKLGGLGGVQFLCFNYAAP